MERQESSTEIFEKFTWKIENFSRLNADKICSEPFILCGYPWRIRLHPKGNKNKDVVDHLSIYLEAMQTANMSEGWRRDVKFKLIVFNQIDTNGTITQ
ncbi:ubiquitin carboxyl-terminal hydrolase 12-like protein, partial [Trifolium pratense]